MLWSSEVSELWLWQQGGCRRPGYQMVGRNLQDCCLHFNTWWSPPSDGLGRLSRTWWQTRIWPMGILQQKHEIIKLWNINHKSQDIDGVPKSYPYKNMKSEFCDRQTDHCIRNLSQVHMFKSPPYKILHLTAESIFSRFLNLGAIVETEII